ncbi:hypothetical protein DFH27DRAFT_618650 [Peziza echinospora]|nr:hypothetical protein DFH27DRAFT_618650 [Peziza echinospora]
MPQHRETLCPLCLKTGHPEPACRNPSRCAYCPDNHETTHHKCKVLGCKKQGRVCPTQSSHAAIATTHKDMQQPATNAPDTLNSSLNKHQQDQNHPHPTPPTARPPTQTGNGPKATEPFNEAAFLAEMLNNARYTHPKALGRRPPPHQNSSSKYRTISHSISSSTGPGGQVEVSSALVGTCVPTMCEIGDEGCVSAVEIFEDLAVGEVKYGQGKVVGDKTEDDSPAGAGHGTRSRESEGWAV